eukprot:scaffold40089_cov59-Attheya_sp.AAC.2
MSRLNIEYTVLSKRRLLKLVDNHFVRGWNDPRMPTISGLRRRGYTRDILNSFCNDVGATRSSNVVEMEKLYQTARLKLSATSRRAMGALEPVLVEITNFDTEATTTTFEVPNSPTDPTLGSHTVTLTPTLYIDSTDFRLNDDPTYYGLAPNKAVGLKFQGGNLVCDEVIKGEGDKLISLKCHLDNSEERPKPKSYITWVPSNGISAEIRVYNHLFSVAEPTDRWEEELNPESETVYPNAILDPSVKELVDAKYVDEWTSNNALQLERIGYFVVDMDTTYDPSTQTGTVVLNRTVNLKADAVKVKRSEKEVQALEARKLKTQQDNAAKEARMQIAPEQLFQQAEEYKSMYSKFDETTGIPTHLADGTELTKSAMKKLAKEKAKHEKALAKYKK